MAVNMSHEMIPRRQRLDASPKFRISVEERETYTYACISSNDPNFNVGAKHVGQILEKCSRPPCERMIIDNRSLSTFGRDELLRSATQFPGYGFAHTRVAIVDADKSHDHDGVNIMIGNSSSIRVRVFESLAEAEKWLTAH